MGLGICVRIERWGRYSLPHLHVITMRANLSAVDAFPGVEGYVGVGWDESYRVSQPIDVDLHLVAMFPDCFDITPRWSIIEATEAVGGVG